MGIDAKEETPGQGGEQREPGEEERCRQKQAGEEEGEGAVHEKGGSYGLCGVNL